MEETKYAILAICATFIALVLVAIVASTTRGNVKNDFPKLKIFVFYEVEKGKHHWVKCGLEAQTKGEAFAERTDFLRKNRLNRIILETFTEEEFNLYLQEQNVTL